MSTVTKRYDYESTAQDWVAHPQLGQTCPGRSQDLRMWWKRISHGSSQPRDTPWLGGSLWYVTKRTDIATSNYWELTKSFENLTVPAGATVTSVNVEYCFRFDASEKLRLGTPGDNQLVMSAGDAKSGPFSLHDSGGTLIGTFSTAQNCIARTGLGTWTGYPQGYATDPITDPPSNWIQVAGTPVSVSLASSTTVKFRIYNTMPANADHAIWPTEFPNTLRHKVDRVIITINYSLIMSQIKGSAVLKGSVIIRG